MGCRFSVLSTGMFVRSILLPLRTENQSGDISSTTTQSVVNITGYSIKTFLPEFTEKGLSGKRNLLLSRLIPMFDPRKFDTLAIIFSISQKSRNATTIGRVLSPKPMRSF